MVSLELPRLSINGWFHGPVPEPLDAPVAPPPALAPHKEVVLLSSWLAGAYMSARARAALAAHMGRASEAALRRVLAPARAAALQRALADPGVAWERCGPALQRRYARVAPRWLAAGAGGGEDAHPLRALAHALSSAAWLRMLCECTDLALSSYRQLEIQKWSAGDFTVRYPL